MRLAKWIHHLLEPHCPDCKAERDEAKICSSCEALKTQLEEARFEHHQLLTSFLQLAKPPQPEPVKMVENQPIRTGSIANWNRTRMQLEAEDRRRAAEIRAQREKEMTENQAKTMHDLGNDIEKLEKELGVQ